MADRLWRSGKIAVLYGTRLTGKTTLVEETLQTLPYRVVFFNANEKRYSGLRSSRGYGALKGLVSGYELLFVDNVLRVPDVGINLKILHDRLPNLRVIVTGSSSPEIAAGPGSR
jgi:predicted AAA+ superfamily ATPase